MTAARQHAPQGAHQTAAGDPSLAMAAIEALGHVARSIEAIADAAGMGHAAPPAPEAPRAASPQPAAMPEPQRQVVYSGQNVAERNAAAARDIDLDLLLADVSSCLRDLQVLARGKTAERCMGLRTRIAEHKAARKRRAGAA